MAGQLMAARRSAERARPAEPGQLAPDPFQAAHARDRPGQRLPQDVGASRVVGDTDVRAEAEQLVAVLDDPQAQAVEGGGEDAGRRLAGERVEPLPQLGRGPPGEGHRQALFSGHALFPDPVRDRVDQGPGLAGAGSSNDQ